ncbi:S4 domain-containing protein YaaA [Natranaerobius thermophilus]|uniref:S4-like RNA binding protein n=1 Tax=Natranaerobius thermophilus (strain ATCC BAA-1301 / DSM 18059 / JW/NM-WN-LF) TaxID=457570 RepID=B2A2Y8_NATTJ|nr:S4 domain-containing protein YaaA [Natranaerobius thermophilus]ACB83602.1 S4-like RNA binding protein [Natranaerobius thermophilus JW/NM-WN-LF]
MSKRKVEINSEYITLGQLLKYVNIVATGGEVKHFLKEEDIEVNGEKTEQRGKKLYPGDIVNLKDQEEIIEITK